MNFIYEKKVSRVPRKRISISLVGIFLEWFLTGTVSGSGDRVSSKLFPSLFNYFWSSLLSDSHGYPHQNSNSFAILIVVFPSSSSIDLIPLVPKVFFFHFSFIQCRYFTQSCSYFCFHSCKYSLILSYIIPFIQIFLHSFIFHPFKYVYLFTCPSTHSLFHSSIHIYFSICLHVIYFIPSYILSLILITLHSFIQIFL